MLHDYNFSELRESITSNSSEFEEQFSYYIRELCWIFLAINNTNSDVYSEMKYNRKFALSEVRK